MDKQTHSPSTLTHHSRPAQLNGSLSSLAHLLCPGLGALVPDQLKPPTRQLTGTREPVFNHELSTHPRPTREKETVFCPQLDVQRSRPQKKPDGGPESRKRGAPLVESRGLSTSLQVLGWRHRSQERAVVQWSAQASSHNKPRQTTFTRTEARPRSRLSS